MVQNSLLPFLLTAATATSVGHAATCGSGPEGFVAWKQALSQEARAKGIGPEGIAALMETSYSEGTIRADRSQHSFKLSLDEFIAKRGGAAIVSRGRAMMGANAALFASIEKRFGVPPGPLIAIWGMETGFGANTGNANTISAVATLAYDCRRPAYFTDHLYAALQLVDEGVLSANTRGAMHGEVGQTQFLPKSILLYGVDGDGDGRIDLNSRADALASTANFLKAHGWVRGAVSTWSAEFRRYPRLERRSRVYEEAIATIGRQIDEH